MAGLAKVQKIFGIFFYFSYLSCHIFSSAPVFKGRPRKRPKKNNIGGKGKVMRKVTTTTDVTTATDVVERCTLSSSSAQQTTTTTIPFDVVVTSSRHLPDVSVHLEFF